MSILKYCNKRIRDVIIEEKNETQMNTQIVQHRRECLYIHTFIHTYVHDRYLHRQIG